MAAPGIRGSCDAWPRNPRTCCWWAATSSAGSGSVGAARRCCRRGRGAALHHAVYDARDEWGDGERRDDAKRLRELGREIRGGECTDVGHRTGRLPAEPDRSPESEEYDEKNRQIDDDGSRTVLDKKVLESLPHA